ncbi:hypothetical protein F7725_026832 [Dissostichus mawsoni]|uniref:DUF4371 domain-containing protein n=1 Tax=Dissostichus mawsoni TaxID=36200 RepID=A0A7J5X960_DISMA|nr:hypothetical protein F7725_026832 [Dissostichus mawsoni]
MSSYKHKSGATKRKEKDKKDQGKPKLSKLDGYFFRPTPPPAGDEPEVVATASRVSSPSPSPPTTLVGLARFTGRLQSRTHTVNKKIDDDNNRDDSAAASCSSRGEPGLTLDQPHPSPSGSLTAAPQGPFPKDKDNRSFSPFYNNAWVNGIKDWKHLSTKIEWHESTQIHLGACVVYEQWKTNGTIDADMERNVRNAAQFWRQVVERIVNVTLTLASSNLAFRGHREVLGEGKAGNFLSIIELLARYDPVLKELINRPEGSVKYLSHQIKDEIIYILSQRVKADIIDEINEAPFYSVIMDTTQDVSKIDQLSQVYRYITVVKNDMDIATDIQINEYQTMGIAQ